MSNSEESVHDSDDENFIAQFFDSHQKLHNKKKEKISVLKSKENILKNNSSLRKKFKKYKLRRNQEDDPDILSVSQTLTSNLTVTSPSKLMTDKYKFDEYFFESRSNYLSKMAKKTKSSTPGKLDNSKLIVSSNTNSDAKAEDAVIIKEDNPNSNKTHEKIIASNDSEEQNVNDVSNLENKPMNAFMLMMGARNRSIGRNSPGKDKAEDIIEPDVKKKSLKLKRKMALEQMATAKGFKKNEEIEAARDENIKVKMAQRAKRLKRMIFNEDVEPKNKTTEKKSEKTSKSKHTTNIKVRKSEDDLRNAKKRFKTCENKSDDDLCQVILLCSDDDEPVVNDSVQSDAGKLNKCSKEGKQENGNSKHNKSLSKSDADFLSKLSPSLKKKESVLSYFDKVEKKVQDDDSDNEIDKIIRVKFTPQRKKKTKLKKSKKLNLKSDDESERKEQENQINETNSNTINDNLSSIEKTNASNISEDLNASTTNDIFDVSGHSERRSKRVSRKPVKYSGDSDANDEILKMSSKKKKLPMKTSNSHQAKQIIDHNEKSEPKEEILQKVKAKKTHGNKNSVLPKLAPIFSPKTPVSKVDLEAKQKFLHSGIPDQLKKIIEKQKSLETDTYNFNAICHVQQKVVNDSSDNLWNLKPIELDINNELDCDPNLDLKTELIRMNYEKLPLNTENPKFIDNKEKLHAMKSNYSKFPVYKIFKQLKRESINNCNADDDKKLESSFDTKINDPKNSLWCDKFRPIDTSSIIGNFDGVSALKQWLINWKESNFDGKNQRIRSKSDSSDSSDFYYPSDTDSKDSQSSFNNVLVITGPSGCGKTTAVYAVSNELSIKVIEVNTSSKRSGKVMLSNLQEATQSHKVNRVATNAENSQEYEKKKNKRKYMKTYSKVQNEIINKRKLESDIKHSDVPTNKNETNKNSMSLILIEDADLVFEQDDGFVSALAQIIQTSKRPVILITTSLNCPHLQKFIANENIIKFHQLSSKMLGMWLDVMCSVENGGLKTNTGQNLMEIFEGDIRKSINLLQFWIESDKSAIKSDLDQTLLTSDTQEKQILDEDNLSMGWNDQEMSLSENKSEDSCNKIKIKAHDALFKTFISTHDHDIGISKSVLQFPINHLNVWWNIPKTFDVQNTDSEISEVKEKRHLKSYSKILESLSLSDVMSSKLQPSINTSAVSPPWRTKLLDSVSEEADMSSFNKAVSVGDSISYALLNSSISSASRAFEMENLSVDYTIPGLTQTRYKEKLWARHLYLNDCLTMNSHLDRRGVSMDYYPTCREICRIEKDRSDTNTKRNNRFSHYLKTLKVNCSEEMFELLSESLSSAE